jgi:hypothetical protein
MQHTLLPQHARKLLRREYHVRAWIVAFFAISVAGSVGVASLFPAFMRGYVEEHSALNTLSSLEKNKNARGIVKLEQELASDKILLTALAEGIDNKVLSKEIEAVISDKGTLKIASITINRISENDSTRIIVQGVSPTREALLAFKVRMESQIPGTTATLPISQLTKSTQIQFSMEIIRPKI